MNITHFSHISSLLHDILGPDLIECTFEKGEAVLRVYSASIVRTLTLLRDHQGLLFKQLVDITAVDYPKRLQRFDVVYHLLSHRLNMRLRVKISIEVDVIVSSVSFIYPNANWYEREVWDLFGIIFSDHPDLRRILTDYNFEGHPLRKDFPLTGYSQVRYDEQEGRVIYEPLSLQNNYRSFDFLSPWEGPHKD